MLIETHIEVKDLDKSMNLYKQIIPYVNIDIFSDKKAAVFSLENGSAFGLWEKGRIGIHGGRGGEHVHFAFYSKPKELAMHEKTILKLGLKVLHFDWEDGSKSIYFYDYDGHQGEFITKKWT